MVQVLSCDIQPLQNATVAVVGNPSDPGAWRKKFIEEGFAPLERILADCSGQHCVGDSITLADVFLVPQVRNGLGVGVDLKAFPTIERLWNNMIAIDGVRNVLEENGGVVQAMPKAGI